MVEQKGKLLQVRALMIGEGRPKICVPITGATAEELLQQAAQVAGSRADMVEWRADWFATGQQTLDVARMLAILRKTVGEMPILFTYRTQNEGGKGTLEGDKYQELLFKAVECGEADLVDVELSSGNLVVSAVASAARRSGVGTVVSRHDFEKTIPKATLVDMMHRMRALGADIPKVAMTPTNDADVLAMLAAAGEYMQTEDSGPVIAISTGRRGVLSRISGNAFGGPITYASMQQQTAEGQTQVEEFASVLDIMYGK